MTSQARRPIRVRIDELRLTGFDPRHGRRIAAAVERHLERLLMDRPDEGGGLDVSRATDRVDGGAFTFRADDPPGRIGSAIAQAMYRGMTGARPTTGPGPEKGK
jgi:hypothetical protein